LEIETIEEHKIQYKFDVYMIRNYAKIIYK